MAFLSSDVVRSSRSILNRSGHLKNNSMCTNSGLFGFSYTTVTGRARTCIPVASMSAGGWFETERMSAKYTSRFSTAPWYCTITLKAKTCVGNTRHAMRHGNSILAAFITLSTVSATRRRLVALVRRTQ